MQAYQTDVAVLMLFFNRPEKFGQVFEQVRQARPSHLFLYQDGPRGERDMEGIMACRKIAENIDWECDVQRHYCEKNQGCDPSEYLSQRWAFSMVDKCIVLEDDDVPSQSFFPFCKDMLDRYEHDNRVWLVSGFNTDEVSGDVPDDYFFTSTFSIWGWASWRRVIETWDGNYTFLDDPYAVSLIENKVRHHKDRKDLLPLCRHHKATGIPYYETIFWASMVLNNGLAILPKYNLINNIGLTADSTHYTASEKTTPRGLRKIFTMKRFELDFPLKHPRYVVDNVAYKDRLFLRNAWGHPWVKIGRSLEELVLNLRYGHFQAISKAIDNRLRKTFGKKV